MIYGILASSSYYSIVSLPWMRLPCPGCPEGLSRYNGSKANAVLPPRPHAAPSVPSHALHLSSARFGASDQRECRLEILLPDRSPMCSLLFHFGKSLIFHWFSKGFWASPRCSPCHGLCFSMFSSHSISPFAVPNFPFRTFHFPDSHSQLRVKLALSLS